MDFLEANLPPLPKPKQPTFKYGSSTYLVLAYAYAYDKAMTVEDFQRLSNGAFRDKNDIKRALMVLVDNRSMEQLNENYWRITPLGIRQALELAEKNKQQNAPKTKKYPLKSS